MSAVEQKYYRAEFEPQAWQHDHAITVDAQGEQTWDCTVFIVADPALKAAVDADIAEDGFFVDIDDVLMDGDAVPKWAAAWDGPFTITVTQDDGNGG